MEIFPFAVLIAGGFFGGFFGAAVGSAGLISLPILLFFGFSPHMAIGTTRPAAVILEAICVWQYRRKGVLTAKLMRRGLWLGIAGMIGSTIGALLISAISDQTLRLLLAFLITAMVIFLFMKKNWGMIEHPARQKRYVLLAISTLLTGLYGGLFGFTAGTVITIVLVSFGYTMLQGAAMGRLTGMMASIASSIVFAWQGYVDFPYAIALSIGFALGGWFGAQAAVKGGNRYIKIVMLMVVIVSVAKLLFDYVSA